MRKKFLFGFAAIAALLLIQSVSRADIIFEGDTLFDTTSGLLWTQRQIPTATFIADGGWTVATWEQFSTLVGHAGGLPGPYSAVAAGLGAWLPDLTYLDFLWVYDDGYQESASCTGPANGGGLCFAGLRPARASDWYSPIGFSGWSLSYLPTASAYGPDFAPYSLDGWDVPYVTALTVSPVSLPAAAWLLFSGLSVVGLAGRGRNRQGTTSRED